MEFNTDSVWSLIFLLILIIIGIVVWYFYNEVEFLNTKTTWLEGKLEGMHEKIYELQPSNSDLEVEYDEEDGFEHDFEEDQEQEEQEQEEIQEQGQEEDQEEDEEFDQEHPKIYEVEQEGCEHVMITGKRKGQSCGKPVKEEGKCSVHS